MIVENGNARLKNKWRRLKKIYTASLKRAKQIIEACVILHNFILKKDSVTYRCHDEYTFNIDFTNFSAEEKRDKISKVL